MEKKITNHTVKKKRTNTRRTESKQRSNDTHRINTHESHLYISTLFNVYTYARERRASERTRTRASENENESERQRERASERKRERERERELQDGERERERVEWGNSRPYSFDVNLLGDGGHGGEAHNSPRATCPRANVHAFTTLAPCTHVRDRQ